jgi:tetratricopeptide (TPR) repeat protein
MRPMLKKMRLYNQLAFYHSLSIADSATFYAGKALELAEKYENMPEKGSAYRNLGNASALAGNYRQAVSNLQRALNIFIELNDPRKIAELYVDLAKLNYDLEDFDKGLEYGGKFMQLASRDAEKGNTITTPFEKAVLIGAIAVMAREAGEYATAENYFKEYIQCSQTLNIPASVHTAYIKLLAETYERAGMLDSALKYTYMARDFLPENKDKPFDEQTGYEDAIGKIFIRQGLGDKAMPLTRRSYENESRNGSYLYAAYRAFEIGDLYMEKDANDSAYYWFQKGMANAGKVFEQINSRQSVDEQPMVFEGYQTLLNMNQAEMKQRYYRLMTYAYKGRYHLFKKTGNYTKALEDHEQ